MKRVSLDTATTAVKQFVRNLPLGNDGVQLELDGKIVCDVLPAKSVSRAERAALIARGRELARRARARNAGVPAAVLEREIQQAVDDVRGRKRR